MFFNTHDGAHSESCGTRSFEVSRDGVVGGRRRPNMNEELLLPEKDFMPFADSTVSCADHPPTPSHFFFWFLE